MFCLHRAYSLRRYPPESLLAGLHSACLSAGLWSLAQSVTLLRQLVGDLSFFHSGSASICSHSTDSLVLSLHHFFLSLVHSQGELDATGAKSSEGAANVPRSEVGATPDENSSTAGLVQEQKPGAEEASGATGTAEPKNGGAGNGAQNGTRVSLSSWEREGLRPLVEVMVVVAVFVVSFVGLPLLLFHLPAVGKSLGPVISNELVDGMICGGV